MTEHEKKMLCAILVSICNVFDAMNQKQLSGTARDISNCELSRAYEEFRKYVHGDFI